MLWSVSPLFTFVGKVFLLLPLCYWGWYSSAEWTTLLVLYFTEPLLQLLFPGLIVGIEPLGYLVEVIAEVTIPAQNVPMGMVAELPVPVNPLIYSYGLPLVVSLILASPISPAKSTVAILCSLLAFLGIQIWGISFEALKILFLQTPPELLANNKLATWQCDVIALGYQLGTLILPAVTPLIIWFIFYQKYISFLTAGFLGDRRSTSSEK